MTHRHWMERLTEQMDLTGEAELESIVELVGSRRVLIEHHKGICQYRQDLIGVHLRAGKVCISGSNMEIARMTKEQLVITGRIDEIKLQGRDG